MRSGREAGGAASWRGPCQFKTVAGWSSALGDSSPEQFHLLKRRRFPRQCRWVLLAGLKASAVHGKAAGSRVITV